MEYPPISDGRVNYLLASMDLPAMNLPDWYLKQWHFHPDGYLSAAGIRWYDRLVRHVYNWPAERSIHGYVANVVARSHARTVLDAGCGTGRLLVALARRGGAMRLAGIDLSPAMLRHARERLPAGTAALRQGDLRNAEVALSGESRVDCAVLMHVLGHVPDEVADGLAAGAIEAVRPGGHLVVVDHAWHPSPGALSQLQLVKTRRFRAGAITVRIYRRPGTVTNAELVA